MIKPPNKIVKRNKATIPGAFIDFSVDVGTLTGITIPATSSFVAASKANTKELSVLKSFEEFSQVLAHNDVVLCSTRLKFLSWCAEKIAALAQDQLPGIGHCAVVTGDRGTGKTFLLRNIALAAVELVPNIIVCYIHYKLVEPMTPLQVLVKLMKETYGADWSSIESVYDLHTHLHSKGHSVIFFVDDLESVFAGSGSEYRDIVAQLLSISEIDCCPRRIIVIATGSSARLRRLCFATATPTDRQYYPTYSGKGFNDRKYACHTVGSLLNVPELLSAKRCVIQSLYRGRGDAEGAHVSEDDDVDEDDDQIDVEHCMGELSLTRGVIQCIIDHVNKGQFYMHQVSITQKRHDATLQKLWYALLAVLRQKSPDSLAGAISDSRHWVSLPTARFTDMQKVDPSIALDDLYAWVDRGFLSLVDSFADAHNAHVTVSFAHGTDLMWAVTNLRIAASKTRIKFGELQVSPPLSEEQRVCFINPAGLDLHKQLMAESLASYYIQGLDSDHLYFEYAYNARMFPALRDSRNWTGELFNVISDSGIDLFAAHDRIVQGVPTLIICLFQCKMTQSALARVTATSSPNPNPNVEDICTAFARITASLQYTMTSEVLDGRQLRFERLLVTPLLVPDDVKGMLQENRIQLIDRAELSRLWPNRVKSFVMDGERTKKFSFLFPTL